MTCASSKAMRYWSEMGPTTPTASRQKAWKLLSCSSSFTNGCAGPSPTAASITNPMLDIDQAVASRPPTIVPMRQFRKSSICSPPLDTRLQVLDSFSQTSFGLESIGLERASHIDHVVRTLRVPHQDERAGVAGGSLLHDVFDRRRPIHMPGHFGFDALGLELAGQAIHAGREHAEPASQQEHARLSGKRAVAPQ